MAAKTKTSATVKNRYAAKAYDRVALIIPKGRKEEVEAYAKGKGQSVNGLINQLLRREMGLSEEAWKRSAEKGDKAD